ncbi:Nif3-like dinuclear metal center hexameric protein [Bacillus altitudinis]|uniref:Nif3-like dinuclear metal center hexameric protein n=1 Tax=Bacillus altitudinis TaxID=293387 RepID=UPI000C2336AE|nr:Nif3-like dinuclear metal center hexameric protein [Bacillus altitudinis]PJI12663.1 Nif3-like dinuclear metal center hexameric protein [Bacillus altitudinis]PKQ85261.1 Nif3-like dinuclear metal center hexameric protein [Bacillus altitudinis]
MAKTVNGHEIIQLFEQFSPKAYAVEGDKIGLQIGTLNKKVTNVMITLDVLENVVDEAIERKVDLIIAHHPPIFRPLKHVATDQTAGRIIEKCIKHDIAVYVAHTNLDVADGGVNDLLAEALELGETKVLVPTYEDPIKQLALYVPVEFEEAIRTALGNAGAGHIGNYCHCAFSNEGTGSFLPSEEAVPFIGETGKLEFVKEVRIETIFPASIEKQVIREMIKAHPYEEVAYSVHTTDLPPIQKGLGRIGELKVPMTLKDFTQFVKTKLDVNGARFVGDHEAVVKKVAVLGGDGNKYIHQAKRMGADVYVTGDLYFHVAHDAMMLGLNVVDPGHYAEKIMKEGVKTKLESLCTDKKYDVRFFVSESNTNPFQFV